MISEHIVIEMSLKVVNEPLIAAFSDDYPKGVEWGLSPIGDWGRELDLSKVMQSLLLALRATLRSILG